MSARARTQRRPGFRGDDVTRDGHSRLYRYALHRADMFRSFGAEENAVAVSSCDWANRSSARSTLFAVAKFLSAAKSNPFIARKTRLSDPIFQSPVAQAANYLVGRVGHVQLPQFSQRITGRSLFCVLLVSSPGW